MTKAMNANLMTNAPLLWQRNVLLERTLKAILSAVDNSENEVLSRAVQSAVDKARHVFIGYDPEAPGSDKTVKHAYPPE